MLVLGSKITGYNHQRCCGALVEHQVAVVEVLIDGQALEGYVNDLLISAIGAYISLCNTLSYGYLDAAIRCLTSIVRMALGISIMRSHRGWPCNVFTMSGFHLVRGLWSQYISYGLCEYVLDLCVMGRVMMPITLNLASVMKEHVMARLSVEPILRTFPTPAPHRFHLHHSDRSAQHSFEAPGLPQVRGNPIHFSSLYSFLSFFNCLVDMAILRDQPGLKVEILIDGVPIQEYDDENEEIVPNVVTKYIEAKSGVNFAIRYTVLPRFHIKHALVVQSYLDGKPMRSHVCSEDEIRNYKSRTMTGVREAIAGKYYKRKFCFSKLNTGQLYSLIS